MEQQKEKIALEDEIDEDYLRLADIFLRQEMEMIVADRDKEEENRKIEENTLDKECELEWKEKQTITERKIEEKLGKKEIELYSPEIYTEKDFFQEVYMEKSEYEALKHLLVRKKNVILQGAPGVGKTFTAKRLAYAIMGYRDERRIQMIQFHQSYSYEEFIMGYKPNKEGFHLEEGIFYQFCRKAEQDKDRDYFFLIDEINRGNLSKLFGELLMLIEADKREEELTLAYNKQSFSVPQNVYIIGMMNLADRGLTSIDYALRRRFGFYTMKPAFEQTGFLAYQKSLNNKKLDALIQVIKELNQEISSDFSLGEDFVIGHSYFCNQEGCSEEWLNELVEFEFIPILKEYWFDDVKKVSFWSERMRAVVK